MEKPSRPDRLAEQYAVEALRPDACGIGIATVSNNKHGKLPMHKFYCEPELKGGNSGVEVCLK